MQLDLKNSANRQTQNLLDESKTEPKSGIKSDAFESNKRRNMYTSCSSNTNCPPHIHRHDGEFGRDRYPHSSSQVSVSVAGCLIAQLNRLVFSSFRSTTLRSDGITFKLHPTSPFKMFLTPHSRSICPTATGSSRRSTARAAVARRKAAPARRPRAASSPSCGCSSRATQPAALTPRWPTPRIS
jgi:hypothetical protein